MKKEIFIHTLLILLGLIFIIINLIVYFSKGNPCFISKKLKVGAMIISLTALFSCGSPSNSNLKPDCYLPPPPKNDYNKNQLKQKQDTILNTKKQKQINDSNAKTKYKRKNKQPIQIDCYVSFVIEKSDSFNNNINDDSTN
jgi:hypothetical protein